MEDIKTITPTHLLKLINDSKFEHEKVKTELHKLLTESDELEILINSKLLELEAIEKQYIILIEEMNER